MRRRNHKGLAEIIGALAIMAFPTLLPEPLLEQRLNLKAEIYDSFVSLKVQDGELSDIPAETEVEVYVFLNDKPAPGKVDYDTETGLAYRGPIRSGETIDIPSFFHLLYVAGIFDIEEKPDGRIISTLPFDVSFGNVDLMYRLDPENILQESDESDNVVRWELSFYFIDYYNRSLNTYQDGMAKLLSLEREIEKD